MKLPVQNLVLLVLMLISASLGAALRPTISLADELTPIDLATMVPKNFGDWREEPRPLAQVVNPQQKSVINKIYSQTLSRTYVNSQGYHIMLSIAYGKNQSDALAMHRPDICYPAQGFTVHGRQPVVIELLRKPTAATLLNTSLGQRHEPITYWTVVGDYIVNGNIGKKLTEIKYAMGNHIPDGMLVRVSSIDPDTINAYKYQEQFAVSLVQHLPSSVVTRFAGAASP